MAPERFRLLAAVVAAHPDRRVVCQGRLQNTVLLLQSAGLSTDYDYTTHFHRPYSEGLQAEIGLLEHMGLAEGHPPRPAEDRPCYVIKAKPKAALKEVEEQFGDAIRLTAQSDLEVLELAATYVVFREKGMTHDEALAVIRRRKGAERVAKNEKSIFELLDKLGLLEEEHREYS